MNLEFVFVVNAIANIVCFVAGYYIAHRGVAGVKSDLADVAMDVRNIKARLTPGTPVSVVAVPPVVAPTPAVHG